MATDWITTRQAAELSGYNHEYLRWLIREGKIRGQKFGTIWQVRKSSLLAYLREADKSNDKRWGGKTLRG
jgi:excisionase family DNA binding protein